MGSTLQARVAMYNAVVHSVLLYVRDRWVVTREILKVLTESQQWVAQRITGITEKRGA